MKPKVLVILGPTSSGKSALAVSLARAFDGEIISADSRQVYKGLDIGTGKVTKKEMHGVPHHLLDVRSPKKIFSAHDFLTFGGAAIADITARGKLPILCGGTGFYIDALIGRVHLSDVHADKKLRARLNKKTPAQLFAMLQKKDPARAASIDRNNPHRLIRALEIAAFGKIKTNTKDGPLYDSLWIGLALPREKLYAKISRRLKDRISQGMIAEGKRLRTSGLSWKRMGELGLEYRALSAYLRGQTTRVEFEQRLLFDIKHFSKRQMTYWRRNKDIHWFSPKDRAIQKTVRKWLATQ